MDPTNSFLIDSTLNEIGKSYAPGTLRWIKQHRPKEWTELLVKEGMINKKALEGDLMGLKEALSRYQKLIFSLCKKFKKEAANERET